MSRSDDTPDSEPIDVEFTPAEPAEISSKSSSSGPGWIGLFSAGVLAALGGGAIGVVASSTEGRYAQAAEVAIDISQLEDYDRTLNNQISQLEDALRETETRLNATQAALDAAGEANGENFSALADDLALLRSRYLALIGASTEAPVDAEAPAEGETEASGEEPAVPRPEISLAALMERLNAIEDLDPSSGAAPQELARSVAALQERAAQLERADLEFADAMEARQAALADIAGDVESLDTALTAVNDRALQIETTRTSDNQLIANLMSDLDGLRTIVNEKISNLEAAELSEDEEELVHRADRVLALSSLETAVRNEDGFSAPLEALAIQMPANSSITQLRRLAETGAPTVTTLRTRLVALKDDVASAGIPEKPSGQWAWVGDLLSGVVTIREEGSRTGETASRRVEAAIGLLEEGNLDGAIRQLRPIDGPQGEILAEWLADAENRANIDRQMQRLRGDVLDGGDQQ